MVRKSGKHGVRSGNTLRASDTRYNRQYHTESCIVRKSTNLSRRQSSQVADDALLDADGVLYSLNKKGRWGLPTMIKENIRHEENDIKISMCERHKLNRQSNCIDFCCNKGQVKSVVSSHGYFNDASVRNGNKGSRRKKKRGQTGQSYQGEENDGTVPDPDPEITYDVLYPSPVTSSISHNSKYIRSAELLVYEDGELREVGRINKKKGKRHRVNVVSEETFSDIEEWDSFDDQQSENEENSPGEEVQSPEMILIDILESAERAKKLCSEQEKRRRMKKRKSKGENLEEQWVVVSKRESEDEAYSSTEEESVESNISILHDLPTTPHLESVRIILQCDTIQPYHLQEQFQDRYMEAQCQPRKFIIDTTQMVTDKMKKSKVANMMFLGSLDFSSCLVFSRDANYDKGLDVYSVQFNINNSIQTIRIETIFDLMATSVQEVVQAAAIYATTLPIEGFQKVELSEIAQSSQHFMKIQLLPVVKKWNTTSVDLHQVHEEEREFEVITEGEAVGAAAAAECMEDINKRPDYCNICFEEINPELFSSASATCLVRCGHWFCDGCWKEHITVRIHSGATKIKCPEYKCGSLIDPATLLSLVNIKHVNMHQKLKNTVDVDRNPNLKWCPNPKCGRVLKGKEDEEDSVTVNCECGKVVCFTCLKDAHWPASCEQTTNYIQKLRKFGDDDHIKGDGPIVHVRGKRCPRCRRYIEKNGGCKYMNCICSYEFCWACLGPWGNYYSHSDCQKMSDKYNTSNVVIKHVDTSQRNIQSSMYKMAVVHRNQRKPMHVRSLKSTMNSLSIRLRGLMSKGIDIGEHSITSNVGSPVSAAAVHEFLVQMMQLKLELNHVIEHTCVLLDERHLPVGARKLGHICERLEGICTSIESNLASKGREELQRAVTRLNYLRPLARRGVSALVSVLAHSQTTSRDGTEE